MRRAHYSHNGGMMFKRFVLIGLAAALWSAPALAADSEESCYQIGYRFGRCAAQEILNEPCAQRQDLEMPERCKGLKETEEGTRVGAREVFAEHGLKTRK